MLGREHSEQNVARCQPPVAALGRRRDRPLKRELGRCREPGFALGATTGARLRLACVDADRGEALLLLLGQGVGEASAVETELRPRGKREQQVL